jgi:4-hydroxybenzoate polyprenyltransferase
MTDAARTGHTDIRRGDWVDRWLPAVARPYARLSRLDRPIGTWLLLFPCWWSTALATDGWPSVWWMALFAIGAVVMRGAGCTVNDILDRDFDGKVERTRHRPIPSGQVTVTGAIAFLLLQLLLGLAVLLQFPWTAIGLGCLSLVLVFTYPLMKRITWWPQFFLGLAFNWGALMGWTAVHGTLGWPAVMLYVAGIAWTLGYDTIYAHQDKSDDALIGVKSSARRLGSASRPWVGGFYAVSVAGLVAAGLSADLHPVFLLGIAAAAVQMGWQVARWRIDDPADCLVMFKSNRWTGWLVLAAFVAGNVVG